MTGFDPNNAAAWQAASERFAQPPDERPPLDIYCEFCGDLIPEDQERVFVEDTWETLCVRCWRAITGAES